MNLCWHHTSEDIHKIFIFVFCHFNLYLFIHDESLLPPKKYGKLFHLTRNYGRGWWLWRNKGFSRELMFEIFLSCLLIALVKYQKLIQNPFFVLADHSSGLEIKKDEAVFTCWFGIHGDLISFLNLNGYERWHLIHIFSSLSLLFSFMQNFFKNERCKVYVKCQGWKFNFWVCGVWLNQPWSHHGVLQHLWHELSFLVHHECFMSRRCFTKILMENSYHLWHNI